MHPIMVWRPDQGHLIIPEALMADLDYPPELHLHRRADGLILAADSTNDTDRTVVANVIIPALDDDEFEAKLELTPEQARQLGLQPGEYTVWANTMEMALYAVPRCTALRNDGDLVAIGMVIHRRDSEVLEALALEHGVRLRDILDAFVADLAANFFTARDERYNRSGGSDEREMARDWFRRSVSPAAVFNEPFPRFERSYYDYLHQYPREGESGG